MKVTYAKHMRKLVKVVEKIRLRAENGRNYSLVYLKLCEAIEIAEKTKLIRYMPETKEEWK